MLTPVPGNGPDGGEQSVRSIMTAGVLDNLALTVQVTVSKEQANNLINNSGRSELGS